MQITPAYLTPPEVARRFGVDVHKILLWIRRGELRALDLSTIAGGRPRYRISPADLAIFEAARSARPEPKIGRCRRRKDPQITEFF